ncbi:type III-B CRISPR module RAMP protein Cmr4 [Dictyobacter arantiisoli]|uniref:Type III-B CRISPR module RAMP protein Cmr4 n=1 Tax=Dictyobacter arantiisoli TaxID=2014874 RepID=A0A5A5TG77_9CHLR|nr:type III-B CRISPR module RAMP protein Cmr4 [Dictyobacter arantiisoli]GCF10225.1 type III-B CRISPR module RAMP protein Cmr4 [Dictyobacter arantiisoli]
MKAQLTFIHTLSSLHAGVGQGAGVIDLPIAREKATSIPYLPGSSLKGSIRTRYLNENGEQKTLRLFGADEVQGENTTASLVQFSDQRLLLLPIRSLAGTFAWVTSPFILSRLQRDTEHLQMPGPANTIPVVESLNSCLLPNETSALKLQVPDKDTMVYLEDLDLQAKPDPELERWAHWLGQCIFHQNTRWQDMLTAHLCLVHDDLFSFLLTTGTEITARIRLQEGTKTVVKGGLWYEETLPAESILSGVVMATPLQRQSLTQDEIMQEVEKLIKTPLQLGGKATVGHGLCRVMMPGKDQ